MNINEIKAVIVVSPNLNRGLAANRAAVLATGLAAHVPGLIGDNLITKDGVEILGFTQVPIPILSAHEGQSILELAQKSKDSGCTTLVFLTRAQGMRSYEAYKQSVGQSDYSELDVDAVAIYGDKQQVTKLTGNMPSLK